MFPKTLFYKTAFLETTQARTTHTQARTHTCTHTHIHTYTHASKKEQVELKSVEKDHQVETHYLSNSFRQQRDDLVKEAELSGDQ